MDEIVWVNPALRPIDRPTRSVTLPLGYIALVASPDRSPLYPLLTGSWARLDLGKTLMQLRYPDTVLLNPPVAADELVVTIGADGIELPPEVVFRSRMSTPKSPIDAPRVIPLVRLTGSTAEVLIGPATSAGLLVSGLQAHTLRPGDTACAAVDGFADLSLAALGRIVATHRSQDGNRVRAAVRVYVPVSIAHLRSSAGGCVSLDDDGLPGDVAYDMSAIGWYPGIGLGAGLRLDVGVAYDLRQSTIGLGLLSAIGFFRGAGREFLTERERTPTSYRPQPPVPTIAFQRTLERDGIIHAETWFADPLGVRVGMRIPLAGVSVLGGVGWDGSVSASVGLAVPIGRRLLEVGARLLPSNLVPSTRAPVFGATVRLGRIMEDE